jgi:glycosidase
VEPWLPVAIGFGTNNVECERLDPTSIYHLHRRLIAVRRRSPSLLVGHYRPIVASAGDHDGAVVTGDVTLRGSEGVVMALAPDVVVPTRRRGRSPVSTSRRSGCSTRCWRAPARE